MFLSFMENFLFSFKILLHNIYCNLTKAYIVLIFIQTFIDNTEIIITISDKARNGFYAYISHDLNNPGGGVTIVYDEVKTNFKDGSYNKHTGIFTVPIAGLYSFTWVTRVECNEAYTCELLVNKKVVGSTFAYCGWNTVTGNALVRVDAGDSVFVRTLSGKGKIRSNQQGRSSFSGLLLE